MALCVKRLLLFIAILFCSLTGAYAQTLYWVGGSGNFSDPAHWSLTSGGSPAYKTPDPTTDVVFDSKSGFQPLVTLTGKNHARSLQFFNSDKLYVAGDPSSELNVSGNFYMNNIARFDFQGKLIFNSTSKSPADVYMGLSEVNCDLYFQSGHWKISQLLTLGSVNISGGKFDLENGYLRCKDLISTNAPTISFSNSGTTIKNKIDLSSASIVNATGLYIMANRSNPALYKVPAVFSNNANVRTGDNTIMACGITTVMTLPTCPNTCDGVISFTFDAGCIDNPYSISYPGWPSGCTPVPTPTTFNAPAVVSFTNLCKCGSTYQFAVTDGSLNIVAFYQVAMVMSDLDFTPFVVTQPSCFGSCNGSINGAISGGTGPYTGTVLAGPTATVNQTFSTALAITLGSLCATAPVTALPVYTLVMRDSKGCIATKTLSMSQPSQLQANGTSFSIACFGACTGSAQVSPTGGTPNYTVNWSTPSTCTLAPAGSCSQTSLCVGPISATVTDSKGCMTTYSTTINQPTAALTAIQSQTNATCGGTCNAVASVTASGGTPGYTYSWSPVGGTLSIASALCGSVTPAPQNYTVIITDANGCSIPKTFTITEPKPLLVSPTFTNAACNGTCNGIAVAGASGGNGGLTYTWTPPGFTGQNTATYSALCAGNYTVTVRDASLCTNQGTVTITQPPPVTITVSQTSVTCNGFCTGSATAAVSGGNGAFNYTWTAPSPTVVITGQTTATVSNLCAGLYTLTVTDNTVCTNPPVTFSISQPPPILPNVTTQTITCAGLCNGVINSAPTGGTGPYTFTLAAGVGFTSQTAAGATASFTNLCGSSTAGIGNYTLTIGDVTGTCTRTVSINLAQPNTLTLTASTTSVTCNGLCNGSLAGSVLGGSPTYTFTWSSPTSTLIGATVNSVCAGPYTLTVLDANGCSTVTSVTVVQPTSISITLNATPPSCNGGCNGSITSTVTGGTPTYGYLWNTSSTLTTISGLCQGNYSLTITDANGCKSTQTSSVTAPLPITITTTAVPTNCAGSCDGQAIASASGGTPPFTYQINTLPLPTTNTTGIFPNLCQGNYVITVTDSKFCSTNSVVTITSPPVLSVIVNSVQPSCVPLCIGAATITASGGNGGFTYTWSPNPGAGQGTNMPSGLCVGAYNYTVQDTKGCRFTGAINVPQSVSITITTTGTLLTCSGSCNGIANANVTGATGVPTFTWLPTGGFSATASGLCAGPYTVNVTDGLGCVSSNTITFANPPAITITSTITNATCNGNCNGQISVTASGGTGTKSYTWSPAPGGGQGTSTATGLCAGVYTLDIQDANNCPFQQTFTVTENAALTATFTPVSPSTCGGTNGSITATVSGGALPYQYTWTPTAQTGSVATNLSAGAYTLTVTDGANCTQTIVATLSDPTGPTVTVTSNSITCNGLCNGSATVSATGTGAISYTWSPPISSTNTVVSGLCQGTFVVNATDATNCLTSQTFAIVEPPSFTLNPAVTNVSCNSACDGSITTSAAGGTTPYSYTWTPGPLNTPTITNLCAGSYTLNGNDASGCAFSQVLAVTQPASITITITKQDILCFGQCNGSITATASGGTGPYTYSWTPVGTFPGSIVNTIINLCSNFYTVTVTDANGCSTTTSVPIFEPIALTATLSVQDALCNSQCNGSATLVASGGTPNYSYTWTPAASTNSIATNLCSGTYNSIVSDANGCTVTQTFIINQPTAVNVTITPTNPSCNGLCNGSITSSVTGGTGAFTYTWIPTAPTQTAASASGLCAGNYTLIVNDANGCIGQNVTALTNPPALLANVSFTNPSCNASCNGIAVSAPSGVGPYSYTWTPGPLSTPTITNLCAGSYTLIVSDNNSCKDTAVVTLVAPATLTINTASTPATCSLFPCNGSLNVIALGGNGGYTYTWSPSNPSPITGTAGISLCAGIYTLTLTDNLGCSGIFSIPLSNSNGPSGATATSTDVTCNGLCNGVAMVGNPITGGTPGYTVAWVTSSTWTPSPTPLTMPQSNLCAGTYTAQINDANNCLLFVSVPINQPAVLNASTTVSAPLCSGNCNGTITSNPTGGNGSYTYSWSTSATTSSITGVCPGIYSLTVTDIKSCSTTQTFNIPASVNITSSSVAINNNCFGDCNGSLLATSISGGLPPYSFNWSDPLGQSTPQAVNLCNGNYFVVITDAQGCSDTLRGTVASPAALTLTSSVIQPTCGLCNGSSTVNASGGSGPYTYTWSSGGSGATTNSLCAGVYMVTITDNLGCAQNVSVTINNSSTLSETITSTNETCFGTCNGAATVTASGGTAPITYNWLSPASTSTSVASLCGGTYFVQMTDAMGCIRNASVNIASASDLTVTPFVTQPGCAMNNGSISVAVSGGTMGYTYSWSPGGATTSSITGLGVGTYSLIVSDGAGCSKTVIFPLTNVNAPAINLTATNALCNGACNAVASLSVIAGTSPYTFNWSSGTISSGANTSTATGLCNGVVTATVTETSTGCLSIQSLTITQPPPMVMSLPILDIPNCNGQCNGGITLVPSGGVLPYTYTWTPTGSTNPLTGLCPGPYTSTITDANGCTAVNSYSLLDPPVLILGANTVPSSCNTTPDGAITTTVSGGLPAYTYSWTGPGTFTSNLPGLTNVLSGTYSLSLTDFAGCRKDTTILIVSTVSVQAIAGNDSSFCQSGSFILNGTLSSGGTTYQWFQLPGAGAIANTLTVSVSPATGTSTYVLVASNSGCISQDTVILTSNPLPLAEAGQDYTITILTSTVIGGSPTGPAGSTFSWVPSTSLDNSTLGNPTASNTVNTTYTVYVTDSNGCVASDTMHVFIFPEIFIPNGFSNNGDGKNDTWIIDNIQQFPNCTVEVYNRWGELLFTSTGYKTPFDGRYKGKDLPVGTYYYIIDLHHENFPKAYTGPLTIFR
jgi:large repetitive protein